MKLLCIVVNVTLCILIASNTALAAAKKKPSKKTNEMMAFNLNVLQLPKHFKGNDIEAIYKKIDKLVKAQAKGEYETTEEFKNRVNKLLSAPIIGNIYINSQLAFVDDFTGIYDGKYVYNADTNKLIVNIMNSDRLCWHEGDSFSIDIKDISETETYTATNGFGAIVKVTMIKGNGYDISGSGCRTINNPKYEFTFKPQIAKKIKDVLAILYVVNLVEPYILEPSLNYSEPTYPSNHGWSVMNYHLNVKIDEVWLFNSETGEILAKRVNNNESLPNNVSPVSPSL